MNPAIQYGTDAALIAVVAAETLIHAKRGFVRTALTLLAAVIAFGVSLKAAEPLASWSYDAFLDKTVCERIEEHSAGFAAADTTKEIIDEVSRIIPDYLHPQLEKINIDLDSVSDQIDSAGKQSDQTARQISQRIIKPAAMLLLKSICLIVCYIVLSALFRLLIHAVCKAAKLPVLHTANKALGGVLGFLKGLLIVYLLALLCGLVGQITSKPEVKQAIDQSKIIAVCLDISKDAS